MRVLKGVKEQIRLNVEARIDRDLNQAPEIIRFIAIYKKKPHSERQATVRAMQDGTQSDIEILEDYLIGWEKLKDSDDEEVPFDHDELMNVCEFTEYRTALVTGLMAALATKEALAKN